MQERLIPLQNRGMERVHIIIKMIIYAFSTRDFGKMELNRHSQDKNQLSLLERDQIILLNIEVNSTMEK